MANGRGSDTRRGGKSVWMPRPSATPEFRVSARSRYLSHFLRTIELNGELLCRSGDVECLGLGEKRVVRIAQLTHDRDLSKGTTADPAPHPKSGFCGGGTPELDLQ